MAKARRRPSVFAFAIALALALLPATVLSLGQGEMRVESGETQIAYLRRRTSAAPVTARATPTTSRPGLLLPPLDVVEVVDEEEDEPLPAMAMVPIMPSDLWGAHQ